MQTTAIPQETGTVAISPLSGQWLFSRPEPQQLKREATYEAQQSFSLRETTALERPLSVDRPQRLPVKSFESESASLIQVWEGTVQEVLLNEGTMRALLRSKIGDVPDHFADIYLEWVAEQDRDLVRPGAVFYLSLYKGRRRGGTVVNSQELRFRRLPAWTSRAAVSVREMAQRLLTKGKVSPEAL